MPQQSLKRRSGEASSYCLRVMSALASTPQGIRPWQPGYSVNNGPAGNPPLMRSPRARLNFSTYTPSAFRLVRLTQPAFPAASYVWAIVISVAPS
jgi:hypothetical protein